MKMRIATAQQMRETDRIAIRERGVPSDQLMERAASAIAEEIMNLAGDCAGRVVCFCGPGNNGGDGVACARQLLEAGFEVKCVLVGDHEKMTPDTRTMEARLAAAGGKLEPFQPDDADFAAWCLKANAMVDAIFGIGLNSDVRGDALTAIHMMNTCDIPVVSADIPSGVEADTGRILGAAVEAERTVTFTLPKAGHYVGKGGLCTGELTVADIGIPRDLADGLDCPVCTVEEAGIQLPRRPRDAHKGDFGRCAILGGSVGYTGAPVLAALAAVRSGAGLVTVGVPTPIWPVAAAKLDEAMPYPLPAGKEGQLSLEAGEAIRSRLAGCGVCLIGPGLGRGNGVAAVVRHLLKEVRVPVVLDADGINALERRGVCPAGRGSVRRRPAGSGPAVCCGAQLLPGAQGPLHHYRLPGWNRLSQYHRQPRYGQGGQRRCAGGDDPGAAGSGPARPAGGAHGGVAPRCGGGSVRPGDGGVRHDAHRHGGRSA